jgi:diadenosine tetraphosphate (Ap4A) HIT family hydrolase
MEGSTEKSCISCDIAEGKATCYKIYEDRYSLALLEINPADISRFLDCA